jgi:hypothetical protein
MMKKQTAMVLAGIVVLTMFIPMIKGEEECAGNPTLINGQVYSGADYDSPTVPDAQVDVTCNNFMLSDTTDGVGYYSVVFDAGNCPLGSNVSACVGDTCGQGMVQTCFDNQINIENIDIFNVPEFGFIAGSMAIVGTLAGFMFLRKKN